MTINSSGTAVGYDDYYPFGVIMPGRSQVSSSDNKYKFTSKERDTETGYDYFGARHYDSELGRWLSVDPLASKYPGWSPYNYTMNNPVNAIDPNGEYTVKVAKNGISVYQQWTLSGARAQLKLESSPSWVGYIFFENRVGRDDPSFRPTSAEKRDKFISTVAGNYPVLGILLSAYDLLQDVKHGDQLALMADEYAFDMALKNGEAVKACLNSDGSASGFPGGDKTTIMMNPELRTKYKNPEKFFKGKLEEYKDEFYNSTVNKNTGRGFSDPDAERIRQSMYGNN